MQYKNTKKGWMMHTLFQEWLDELNESMKKEGRHVLLHLTTLLHVAEKLLGAMCRSRCFHQTPHRSCIQWMQVPSRVSRRTSTANRDATLSTWQTASLTTKEKSTKDIYKVDVLQAMHWCRDAWESVMQSTIANCWKHTGIIPEDLYELI